MISFLFGIWEWLWHLLESTVERIEIWFVTRRWEFMPGGLPALLVAGALLFIVIGQKSKPAVAVAEPYRQAFRAAIDAKDYERAELFLRKLIDLKVADDGSRFQFALLAYAKGKTDVALEQMSELAPEGKQGYPLAHLWLAQVELQRQANWKDEDRKRCLWHLTAAKADASVRPRVAELLGMLHLVGREYAEAVEELKSISEPSINVRVALAIAYQLAGRQEESRTAWTGVVSACERQLSAEPDRTEIRLLLAIACSRVQQHDKAAQVLRDGISRPSGVADRRLQEALGLALVQKLGFTARSPGGPVDRQKLLQEVLDLASDSPAVALRLVRWPAADAGETKQIRDELKKHAEEGGPTAPALHTVLGTASAQSGDLAAAREHLEKANQQKPNNPGILNNLAWVLANSEPPELDRALELVNKAVELLPEDAQIRETRGQILVRKKQWQAAIIDLELALPKIKPESVPAVKKALAEAHEGINSKSED